MLPVLYNNTKRIVQTEDYVMILVEMNHDARIIRMNAEHEPTEVRRWLGDSIGRWDGDTLVVDTTNFRDQTGLGSASRDLHVIERFTRFNDNTLHYEFTVDDPATWTAPWKGDYTWPATEERVYEYACHEGKYALCRARASWKRKPSRRTAGVRTNAQAFYGRRGGRMSEALTSRPPALTGSRATPFRLTSNLRA